ncbi:hypothetical protein L207DRAFT_590052 [Hyaloscypha variabilis F]|uniref:2EXR domain-containing protein n=1 Tax=Hyaloscypha variabilis (strain UAMH 11265 / GT02V1 / F) TaxID=1149755 RepID=A0A2J6R3C2_HYAVF|nr:hypothetical protein L207DRAFT_590052 [Hyaloscypha variabilis F]
MATDEPTHPSSMVSTALPHCNAHVDHVKSLLSRLKPLEIPQKHQDLTIFTPFPKLPIELRVMIWTLVSTNNPQCIPLCY